MSLSTMFRNSNLRGLFTAGLAIVAPPVCVLCHDGVGSDFWWNVLLTLTGYVPGFVHAGWLWIAH